MTQGEYLAEHVHCILSMTEEGTGSLMTADGYVWSEHVLDEYELGLLIVRTEEGYTLKEAGSQFSCWHADGTTCYVYKGEQS